MHLAADYVHPLPGRGRCRVRIYVPEEEPRDGHGPDAPVVVFSEVPGNPGASVTSSMEALAAEILRCFGYALSRVPVFVEHWPPEATDGATETYDLVVFARRAARGEVLLVGEGGEAWPFDAGRPEWKPLDRRSVETLVGQPL